MTSSKFTAIILIVVALALAACTTAGPGASAAASSATPAGDAAATYCTQSGGVIEMRYPYYGTGGSKPLRLSGSQQFCVFSAPDKSQIWIATDTLYTDKPSLAAIAYHTKPAIQSAPPNGANPSSIYCSQLGGTDLFGGTNSAGGGWAKDEAKDPIAMCIFPDLSIIDSWGLAYHANDTIRGTDLSKVLRYKAPSAQ